MENFELAQIILISVITLVFTSLSYSIFITYLILKKFSDFGDSSCKLGEYAPKGVGYTRMVDDVPPNEKFFLFADYGVDPYSTREHSIPEVLLKNMEKENMDNDII